MNLIEQLGGYEAAKSKCDRANKEGYLLLSVPVQNGFGDIYVYKVEAALLEYRRQHKIYEINDNVVLIDGNDLEDDRIFYVDYNGWCTNLSVLSKQKYKDIRGYTYPKKWFRHATNAEIEAGKRSEVV